MIVRFVDVGGLVDHPCLEVIVQIVDVCVLVDHHSLDVIVRFVDVGGLVDHHCTRKRETRTDDLGNQILNKLEDNGIVFEVLLP